jgi:aspartyl protease family protein
MRNVMAFAALALVVAAVVPRFYTDMDRTSAGAATVHTVPREPASAPDNNRTMTISRGSNGHFSVAAEVDGRRMEFLVDTGASFVALRESDASRLGIHPSRREYTWRSATANGVIRVAPVELNRVDVGSITVHNVQAVVIPDEMLGQSLLGMSFLSRVRWQHDNGRLILEQ